MKTFDIEYHHDMIHVTSDNGYKLSYPDGRWMHISKQSGDTGTVSIFNDSTSYATASSWVVESKSEGPDWLNKEQLQVIAEIIVRKEQENNKEKHSSARA